MSSNEKIVFIIDDDQSVRKSLELFLKSFGYRVESYGSSEEYLGRESFAGAGCLILDVNLDGKNGIQLQQDLIHLDSHLPIIFITGMASIQLSVHALKKGAVNFLEKPFDHNELLQSVDEALALSEKLLIEKEESRAAHKLVNSLSPREIEVLMFLTTGLLNKQTASELHISEQTVKIHRQNICAKLGVKSVPEIIRIADKAGISPILTR